MGHRYLQGYVFSRPLEADAARRRRLGRPAWTCPARIRPRTADRPLNRRRCRRDRLQSIPREVRWTVPLALLGLALAVPFSAPDGTGMQWDELVLGRVAASAAWTLFRLVRGMEPRPPRGRGWSWSAARWLFMAAQLARRRLPGPGVRRLRRGRRPAVHRRRHRRWSPARCSPAGSAAPAGRPCSSTALIITAALLIVTEVLRTPLVNPVGAPDDLRSLVLAYGGYAAVMLGGAGALCTVSTAALRRSASVMLGAVAWQAAAACFEAMAIISPSCGCGRRAPTSPSPLGLQTVVLAAGFAPTRFADRTARAGRARRSARLGMRAASSAPCSACR